MHRIVGIVLPDDKRIDFALTTIYGIGWPSANKILQTTKIDKSTRVKNMTDDQIKSIVAVIDKSYNIEGELREQQNDNIKKLKDIGTYRGFRHRLGLPVRGQRTRSNARTKRGKRKTVGALSKEIWAKMEQQTGAAPTAASPKAAPTASGATGATTTPAPKAK
ncbi:30S ribosomal protein S13 [Candidatus Roizmanbacteria bacterium RIFCSPHIGHO2_01_FULL_38_15]|nr:MAG: 30S ribosomal protein S13 [Candidatus Roizmanbacteria bacterium RIFCSPHIGHO2_01_FULL_38_15]OGK35882.1 MAG: 30S ribosomal protein S13 [Candidatus Roizmanbacteria bacterium RIFCSPHIGHO2_12_FULL_38_13]